MSRFTHAICDPCWAQHTRGRTPYRLTEPREELCCFCGSHTTSGIFVRQDPKDVPSCPGHSDDS